MRTCRARTVKRLFGGGDAAWPVGGHVQKGRQASRVPLSATRGVGHQHLGKCLLTPCDRKEPVGKRPREWESLGRTTPRCRSVARPLAKSPCRSRPMLPSASPWRANHVRVEPPSLRARVAAGHSARTASSLAGGSGRGRLQLSRSGRDADAELTVEEEDEAAEAAAELLLATGGDSTQAGAASILADAGGLPTQVSSKATEVSATLSELDKLASSEREVLLQAQQLLDRIGMRGVTLLAPEVEEDTIEE